MSDRHVRGVSKLKGELSSGTKTEFCKKLHVTVVELAGDTAKAARDGDLKGAWEAINEARSLADIGQYCVGVRYRI